MYSSFIILKPLIIVISSPSDMYGGWTCQRYLLWSSWIVFLMIEDIWIPIHGFHQTSLDRTGLIGSYLGDFLCGRQYDSLNLSKKVVNFFANWLWTSIIFIFSCDFFERPLMNDDGRDIQSVSFGMILSDFPLTRFPLIRWNLILINKNNVSNYQD